MWKCILQNFLIIVVLPIYLNCNEFSESNIVHPDTVKKVQTEINATEVLPVAINKKEFLRQIAIPSDPIGLITNRIPCDCNKGVCKCCIGNALAIFRMQGCMEVVYTPEDFAFELRMKMGDQVLFKNKVSGKNPPPMCVTPPRFPFAKVCVTFYDVYFFGRNMHACMDVGAFVEGYELFSRTFDCLRLGAQGVKIVKPEEGYPIRPGDVDIDQGNDDEIEDYDENVVRAEKPHENSSSDSDDDDDDNDDDDEDDDDDDDDDALF